MNKITRKDYEEIAAIIKTTLKRNYYDKRDAIVYIANALATKFEMDNNRFDKEKFLDACGLKEK